MSADEILELKEFKKRVSLFLNLDYVEMKGVSSFDEYVRGKVQESQEISINQASQNASRLCFDLFNPLETKLSSQIDNLVRDSATTRTQLQKI